MERLLLHVRCVDGLEQLPAAHGGHGLVHGELELPGAGLRRGVDAGEPEPGAVLVSVREHVGRPLRHRGPVHARVRQNKVNTAFRIFQTELYTHFQHFALSH